MPKSKPDDAANRSTRVADRTKTKGQASFQDLVQSDSEPEASPRQTYGVNYHIRSAYGQLILLIFFPVELLSKLPVLGEHGFSKLPHVSNVHAEG